MNPLCQNLLRTSVPLLYWKATIGGNNEVYWESVQVDSSGNIYAAGGTGNRTYGVGVIAKYDSAGSVVWVKGITGASSFENVFLYDIKLDSSGNIYCVGSAGVRSFAVKLNSSGVIQWQNKYANVSSNFEALDCDASGNLYCVGRISTTPSKAVVMKLNSSGTIQWQNELTDTTFLVSGKSVVADGSGNVYVLVDTTNSNDTVLVKYDSSGVLQWQRENGYTSNTSIYGTSLYLDSSANVHYTAQSSGTSDFVHIYRYNSSGTLLWGKIVYDTDVDDLGTGNSNPYTQLFIDSSNAIYLATGYRILANQSNWGVALMEWNTSGTLLQANRLMYFNGSNGYIDNAAFVLDNAGSLYFVGGEEPQLADNFVGHITKLKSNLTGLGTFGADLRYQNVIADLTVEVSLATEAAGALTSASSSYSATSTSYPSDTESLSTALLNLT